MTQLDDLDRAIIRVLKQDARLTISQIAQKLDRPESTIHFRIKKLQEKGVIDRYTIVLGDSFRPRNLALVYIQAETPVIEEFLERYVRYVMRTLSMLPNVMAVARSGKDGVVALIGEDSPERLNRFIDETIRTLPTLKRVEVFELDEFAKGGDLAGFLVGV
ncbi:transcriptional regulator [Thermococcus sp. P6]|uniref:Lrp/AsnC family transcriptional regulator n=1 Tax=Thermococcus sp. P6 TaxID=122420 RepID=UPI000B59EC34|nr:Lrp/AsnC family transcriptional regulator [Thermococcus sp. P6]ASJ10700.1 transcriptional regulator [Thermococcus sp. P6]